MRIKTMAASFWRRHFRKAIPAAIVANILAVLAARLVSAVGEARRAVHASVTT